MRKWLSMMILLLLVGAPIRAQDEAVIVISVVGVTNALGPLDPINCISPDACMIADLLFPRLIGVDPQQQRFTAGAPGNALTLDWEISADGLVYIFNLRNDRSWTDGTPITADDVVFSYEALGGNLPQVRTVMPEDAYTVRVEYSEATCSALNDWNIGVLPAHAYDDAALVRTSPASITPAITAGPFRFGQMSPERLVLPADPDYTGGAPQADAIHIVTVADDADRIGRLLQGEIHYANIPTHFISAVQDNTTLQTLRYPGLMWEFVGLNLADPADPQPAYTDLQEPIAQAPHPILGDAQVRRALQHGINVPELIQHVYGNNATQMASYMVPSSWALHPDLEPVPHDQDRAAALLDAVGWLRGEDDVRIAADVAGVEDGTELRLTLHVNAGGTSREQVAAMISAQLAEIDVVVNVEIIGFDALYRLISSQTFDMFLLGWINEYPVQPRPKVFLSTNDSLNGLLNFGSYVNTDVDQLTADAHTLPGCNHEERAAIYREIQEILQADQPYLFLYAPDQMYAANGIDGFNPYPNAPMWNITEWAPQRWLR